MTTETTDSSQPGLLAAERINSPLGAIWRGKGEWILMVLALVGGAAIRLTLAFRGWPFVNSDEATLGLMVDDILWHGGHPLFTYGVHHLGAIDAYLQAPFFVLLGPTNLTMRIVTTLQTLFFLVIFYLFTRRVFSAPVALVSLFLLVFGAEQAILFELRANRHDQDVLVFSALLLWLVYLRLRRPSRLSTLLLLDLGIGLVAGIGLWNTLLTLPFALAALLALGVEAIKVRRNGEGVVSGQWPVRQIALLVVGFLVGFMPYTLDIFTTRGGILREGLSTASVGGGHGVLAIIQQLGGTFIYGVPSMFGSSAVCSQCPPWPTATFAPPTNQIIIMTITGLALSAIVVSCWLAAALPLAHVAWQAIQRNLPGRRDTANVVSSVDSVVEVERTARWWGRAMLAIGTGLTVLQYVSSRAAFIDFTAPRYLMGVYLATPFIAVPLYASLETVWRWFTIQREWRTIPLRTLLLSCCGVILLLALFTVNIIGEGNALQASANTQQFGVPAGTRDAQVLDFLTAHHATRFYTTWLVCYHLMFASQEKTDCNVVSTSNPLAEGPNLMPTYAKIARAAPHPAYVFDTTTGEVNQSVPQEIVNLIATGDPRFVGYISAVIDGYIVFYYAGSA